MHKYIFASKQIYKYFHLVNELRIKCNIYRGWTLIIAFQTKNTPENTIILFIFRGGKFWRGLKKKDKNTANAALNTCRLHCQTFVVCKLCVFKIRRGGGGANRFFKGGTLAEKI